MCCSPGGGKGVSLRLCLATAMHFPQEKERGRSSRTPVLITVLSTGAEGMQEAEGAPFLTWASSPWASCRGRRGWRVPCGWQWSSTGLSSSWRSCGRWGFGRPAPGGSFWTWTWRTALQGNRCFSHLARLEPQCSTAQAVVLHTSSPQLSELCQQSLDQLVPSAMKIDDSPSIACLKPNPSPHLTLADKNLLVKAPKHKAGKAGSSKSFKELQFCFHLQQM